MNTIVDSLKNQSAAESSSLKDVIQVLCAALILGVSAHIKIPLFFTPIPLTMQTMVVLMSGAFLGRQKALSGVLLYLMMGGFGMPMFTGGSGSFSYLFGASGGYLLGFAVQAYLVGCFAQSQKSFHAFKVFSTFSLCCLIQLGIGAVWLAQFVGWDHIVALGVLPFLPGELLKSLIATGICKGLIFKR